jgi:hypothetical protein
MVENAEKRRRAEKACGQKPKERTGSGIYVVQTMQYIINAIKEREEFPGTERQMFLTPCAGFGVRLDRLGDSGVCLSTP